MLTVIPTSTPILYIYRILKQEFLLLPHILNMPGDSYARYLAM